MTNTQMEFSIARGQSGMSDNFKSAILALREGKMVLLLDAHDRENEGDLIIAAEKITTASMNFLIQEGSGVVCLAMPRNRLQELGLPLMMQDNTNYFKTAFTISIEARSGVTTGVSAKDRAHTISVAIADDAQAEHLARPGHVFPLAAQLNGVFDRMGHTEGSVDLMRIAGLKAGAVLCELMNDDGSMTLGDDRINFAKRHNIPVISVEEVFFCRMHTEEVFAQTTKQIPTRFGDLVWHSFRFFNSLVVDMFHHQDLIPADGPKRLALTSGDNLSQRFMAQVLTRSQDDALVCGLEQLQNQKTDIVIMTSQPPHGCQNKTASERMLRENAAICRALKELAITAVDSSVPKELGHIASTYFFINVAQNER